MEIWPSKTRKMTLAEQLEEDRFEEEKLQIDFQRFWADTSLRIYFPASGKSEFFSLELGRWGRKNGCLISPLNATSMKQSGIVDIWIHTLWACEYASVRHTNFHFIFHFSLQYFSSSSSFIELCALCASNLTTKTYEQVLISFTTQRHMIISIQLGFFGQRERSSAAMRNCNFNWMNLVSNYKPTLFSC